MRIFEFTVLKGCNSGSSIRSTVNFDRSTTILITVNVLLCAAKQICYNLQNELHLASTKRTTRTKRTTLSKSVEKWQACDLKVYNAKQQVSSSRKEKLSSPHRKSIWAKGGFNINLQCTCTCSFTSETWPHVHVHVHTNMPCSNSQQVSWQQNARLVSTLFD